MNTLNNCSINMNTSMSEDVESLLQAIQIIAESNNQLSLAVAQISSSVVSSDICAIRISEAKCGSNTDEVFNLDGQEEEGDAE